MQVSLGKTAASFRQRSRLSVQKKDQKKTLARIYGSIGLRTDPGSSWGVFFLSPLRRRGNSRHVSTHFKRRFQPPAISMGLSTLESTTAKITACGSWKTSAEVSQRKEFFRHVQSAPGTSSYRPLSFAIRRPKRWLLLYARLGEISTRPTIVGINLPHLRRLQNRDTLSCTVWAL